MKFKITQKGAVIAVLGILLSAGCYYDTESLLYPGVNVDCATINATYGLVKNIMTTKCATAGCHNTASAAGATILETYDQVKAKAARIQQRTINERNMPPGAPLSPGEMAILKCWINSGMPNN